MHRHCHHHAIMGYDADKEVMKKIGVEVNVPDNGCCGLAGSFGFEEGRKYDLIEGGAKTEPARMLRQMSEDLLITDGLAAGNK